MLAKIKFCAKVILKLGFGDGVLFLIRNQLNSKTVKLSNITHPIFLRPGTTDVNVFLQIFRDKEYHIDLGFEPEIIIDGGANVGLASIYFKNKYPNAKIIAIEPDSENVEALKANVAKYDHIYIKQAGIWSSKTKSKISNKYGLGKWAMVIEECDSEDKENALPTINTVTIDELMEEYGLSHIDLLKLDIETAEKEVFSGNYMSWLPKTRVVIVELHDWMAPGCSKPFFSAINEAFNNYSFSQIGENTVIVNNDFPTTIKQLV